MTERGRPDLLSIVAPAYNEERGLPRFLDEVRQAVGELAADYEILVVDDGSRDGTPDVLRAASGSDPRVRYVSLSRNFGHQAALLAGIAHARGDVVVSMDADLQHPPELIPEMVEAWRSGADVVYTVKRATPGAISPMRRALMWGGYSVLRTISGMNLRFGQSDFRLLDRSVVDVLVGMPEREKFLRGLVEWVGFRQVALEYEPRPRFTGVEKYTFRQLLRLVTTGVFAFTILPLRLFTATGFVIALLAFLYGLFAVGAGAYALITGDIAVSPPGWASVAAAISFLGGLQLMGIGLLGEYLGRVYDEAKARPPYVVRESSGAIERGS